MSRATVGERIYIPISHRHVGLGAWPLMLRDLWSYRELCWRLAHRDITVLYRQSLLGLAWVLILPILTVALFTYLASMRLLPIGETPIPYPAYALWGVVLWQLFASTLSSATGSLAGAGALVTKIDFPKEVVVFASAARPLVEFSAKLPLVLVVFWVYEIQPNWSMLLLLPVVLLAVLMSLGVGLVLSLANLIVRDVGNLVGILVTFGIFSAPVLYPPPQSAPFSLLVVINPFNPLLMATQDLIGEGVIAHPGLLLAATLVSLLCFFLGWRVFRLAIRRVTERA